MEEVLAELIHSNQIAERRLEILEKYGAYGMITLFVMAGISVIIGVFAIFKVLEMS